MNETEININWFKKVFLGFLGSIALSKALYSYNDVLPFESINFSEPFDLDKVYFLLVWLLALVYFIANLIRYYMSSFIYNAHSDETNESPKEMFDKEWKTLNLKDVIELKGKIIDKLDTMSKNLTKIVSFTILDLIIYSLSIFVFGLAAMNMCEESPLNFFILLWSIVVLDLIHLLFQKYFYYNKYNAKQKFITKCMREVLDDEIKELEGDVGKVAEVTALRDVLENHKNTDSLSTVKKALKNWIIIDLIEVLILSSGIVLHFIDSNSDLLWLTIILIALSFIFIYDVNKNKNSWAKLFGINK